MNCISFEQSLMASGALATPIVYVWIQLLRLMLALTLLESSQTVAVANVASFRSR